jgi:hypothetical protein
VAEATPPAPPPPRPPAAQGTPATRRSPRPVVALAFAIAAVLSAWNPLAAPFGLVVGIAAAALGVRALVRRVPGRHLAIAAVVLGVVATVGSVAVLALTTGVGVDLPSGEAVVRGRTVEELDKTLGEAGERTRAERERAARELERLTGERPDRPDAGAPPQRRRDSGIAPQRRTADGGSASP